MYKKPTDNLRKLAQKAFGYTGNTFQVFFDKDTYTLTNVWFEGSKNHAVMVRIGNYDSLEDFEIITLPEMYKPEEVGIPHGFCILEHIIFQGKDLGIRLYLRPDRIPEEEKQRLFKEAQEIEEQLSNVEKVIVYCFLAYKSSDRKPEALDIGISVEDYEQGLVSLKEKRIIMKNNALSLKGKNLRDSIPKIYELLEFFKNHNS